MVALLICLVVALVIAVVTFSVTAEMRKPATESNESRRAPRHVSRPSAGTARDGGRRSGAVLAGAASKGGRTVVESGRQFGRNLADLARSSIAIAPSTSPKPSPNGHGPGDEVRGDGTVLPLGAPASPNPPPRPTAEPVAPPPKPVAPPPKPVAPPPKPVAPPPKPVAIGAATARAVAAARTVAASSVGSVTRATATRRARPDANDEYELIVPSTSRKPERLYPAWWRRIASFIMLGVLTLLVGVALGTAIGAGLAFLYRAVQGSL